MKRELHGGADSALARLDQEVLDASQLRRVDRAAAQKRERGAARLPFEIARRAGLHRSGEASSALPGRHHVHAQALGIGGEVRVMVLVANVNASQPQRGESRQPPARRGRRSTRAHPLLGKTDPAPVFAHQTHAGGLERDVKAVERSLEGAERKRDLDAPGLDERRPAGTSELEAFHRDVTGDEVVVDAGVADRHAERGTQACQADLDERALDGGQVDGDENAEDQGTQRHQPPPDPPPQPRPARFVRLLIPAHRSILPSFVGAHAVRPYLPELKLGPTIRCCPS